MSSLPQGWHGVVGPCKTPTSGSAGISGSSVPVTIRKKWNSPMSSNVPQTKLPSYKSSNLRHQNHSLNSTYQIKPPVTVCPSAQTKLPTPTKPSPVKEYKDEIAKLKKELSTIKAENSILKAKVRRVDDENLQKGRQIEKMRAEIKALQKNDSANSRRSKESQELFSLRQKCLRLENALKDKDLAIRRLTNECLMRKEDSESLKTSTVCTPKQIYQVSCAAQLKHVSKNSEKESISAKSNLSRTSHTLKTEVTKLRDIIHKLEKENQDLQQQAKLHCQDIRRLKVQLKSKVTQPQTSILKPIPTENSKNAENKSESITSNNQKNVQTKITAHSSFVPKQKFVKNTKSLPQNAVAPNPAQITPKQPILQKPNPQKSISKIGRTSSLPNGSNKKLSSSKQTRVVQSKLPVTKSNVVRAASKPVTQKTDVGKSAVVNSSERSDLEHKIQEMRENIAAKKIQRSWREHQKNMQHSADFEFQSGGKALTFIISSMKHHKLRKGKLNILVKKRNHFPENIRKETFMEAIESISKKVWDQDFSTS